MAAVVPSEHTLHMGRGYATSGVRYNLAAVRRPPGACGASGLPAWDSKETLQGGITGSGAERR
jgi:hypothetical protein